MLACRSVYRRMTLGSKQYPNEYFKSTTCRLVVRMPQHFVQNGSLTWTAVLSHLELWAELEWLRHGADFSGQKTLNSSDPALKKHPENADRTLAYLYTGEFYNVATCKAYKNNEPPPRKVAEKGDESSSKPESSGSKKSSNPPSPARNGAQPAQAPTSQKVTTKEQAQEACVTEYKRVLTTTADDKAALDAAHVELHKYHGIDGLQAATKGPHVKVLVDAGLGTASSTESQGSVKTGAGTARAYFVPTWKPSKKKRKRVVSDDDSES